MTRITYGNPLTSYETEFEPETRTVWGYFTKPHYSLDMLNDILDHDQMLSRNGKVRVNGVPHAVDYYVTASRVPGIFNSGGDLALFAMLIRAGDRKMLEHYAKLCIDNIYPRTRSFFNPRLTKIALVQGHALGGGFECALASDVIIAEERAEMGLPEVLFNMFPGMGACSLLARRIGMRAAEELVVSGKLKSALELHKLGVVDVLAPDGQGESATQAWIKNNIERGAARRALNRARHYMHAVTREELDDIVAMWVDSALRLGERDLKMMDRLVRAQAKRAVVA